jgi:ubiquinone/menaquinone biosynthesis C-methylase UbiE
VNPHELQLRERIGMPVETNQIRSRLVRTVGHVGCILDVGCANCDLVRFLASTVADEAFGIDVKGDRVDERVACEDGGSSHVARCEKMDAQQMAGFPSGRFDAVVSVHTLHEIAAPDTALQEMRRVLKRGGTLFIADFTKGETRWPERYFTTAEVRAMLTEAGFAEIQVGKVRGEHFMFATASK